MERGPGVRFELKKVTDLTAEAREALRSLSAAVYPPHVTASWPGRAIEWTPPQWSVIAWEDDGRALSHVGVVLREGRADGKAVRIGGIGGVLTHPLARKRGLASQGIRLAIDFFREEGVDFALLVCEPELVPLYENLGWNRHEGELCVRQGDALVRFTFNLPMTFPVGLRPSSGMTVDLMGPPW